MRYHYNTSRLEVDTLHAAGVAFGLIAEFDTRTWHPPVHSPETGSDHARKAVAVANQLGMPPGAAVWLTIDTSPAGRHPKCRRYFELAAPIIRDAGYRVGAYGGDSIIDELVLAGLADLAWIAGAVSWSEGHRSTTACLRQLVAQPTIGGVTVDLNDVLADDCGWWLPPGATPTTPPKPTAPANQETHPMLAILYFAGKPERWAFGYGPDGEWCHLIDSTDSLFLLEMAGVPVWELGAKTGGNDILDATFKRLTGL